MKFFFALTSIFLAGSAFSKEIISTIYGPMDILALSEDAEINNQVVHVNSEGIIGVGGDTQDTINFTVALDTTDRALYSLVTAPVEAQYLRVYLVDTAWRLTPTEAPLSPFGFDSNSYLYVNRTYLGYVCKSTAGNTLHWGETPSCNSSVNVTLQALLHA